LKSRRLQFAYRKSASKLHRSVGDWLRQTYPCYRIYQEYPVQKINPSWPNGRARYDWVILDLKVVIECHGEQHSQLVQWGPRVDTKIDCRTCIKTPGLKEIQEQDSAKETAARSAGFGYVVIQYNEKPEEVLLPRIQEALETMSHSTIQLPKPSSKRKKELLDRARQYRKEQYRKQKIWRKTLP